MPAVRLVFYWRCERLVPWLNALLGFKPVPPFVPGALLPPRRQAKLESAEQARVASNLIFTINEFTLGE